MAVADITLIVEYLPFVVHRDLWPWLPQDESQEFSWGWAAYFWFHTNFSIVIHNVSIWLTLTVAVWRFIMIKYHTLVPVYCTMERCHYVLLSAYGIALLYYIDIPTQMWESKAML
jgi:thyrotropin-releasing hormone receptor